MAAWQLDLAPASPGAPVASLSPAIPGPARGCRLSLASPPRMGSAPPTLQTPLCRQLELNKCSNYRVLKLGGAESSSRPTASSLHR